MLDAYGIYEWGAPAVSYTGTPVSADPAPVNGVCGSGGGCAAGSGAFNQSTSGLTTTWVCAGSIDSVDKAYNGANSSTCSETAGSCGSTPQTCATGSVSGVIDSSGQSIWTCVGVNGGSNASCNMCDTGWVRWGDGSCQYPVPGQCGGGNWSCAAGSPIYQGVSNYTDYWHCSGTYGAADSGQCSYAVPTQGQCGGSAWSCNIGSAYSGSSDSYYNYWYCLGINGGGWSDPCATQYCSANWHVTGYGSCSNTCGDGTQDVYWSDGCGNANTSQQGCSDYSVCPVDGQCGGGDWTCNVGDAYKGSADSYTHYWQCSGVNGGNSSGQCTHQYCASNGSCSGSCGGGWGADNCGGSCQNNNACSTQSGQCGSWNYLGANGTTCYPVYGKPYNGN
jgi:hypothetical protein